MTRKDAASRLFCYHWLAPLRRLGVRADIYPPSSIPLYELFCERREAWPLALLAKAIYWYLVVPPTRLWQIAKAFGSDVVFIQRGMWRYDSPPVFERLAGLLLRRVGGAKIIYQFDDAIYVYVSERHYQARFGLADLVITGNEELATYAAGWNSNVALIESTLDLEYYLPDPTAHIAPTTIGWVGTHPDDLRPLRPVFEELARRTKFRLHVVGPPGFEFVWDGVDIAHIPWALDQEISNLQRFDVGIMPLRDTRYDRGREAFKVKQYMALGLPVVATAVGKNTSIVEDGITGFLVSTNEEWIERLQELLERPAKRQELGKAGRALIEERYDLRRAVPDFIHRLHTLANGEPAPASYDRHGGPGMSAAEGTDTPVAR